MSLHASKPLAGLALCALFAAGCDVPPPVSPTADPRQSDRTSRIEGNVVVSSADRGNVVVLLYDAARPPPPQGTGRPVSFTLVRREQLFGAHAFTYGFTGPFTAPFTFSLVPPGRYTVRALLDVDTCLYRNPPCRGPDFNPWYSVTSEANAGDIGGAAVDLTSGTPVLRVVELRPKEDGTLPPVTGLNVSVSGASIPLDRPAFRVEGSAVAGNSATLEPNRAPNNPLLLSVVRQDIRDTPAERDGLPERIRVTAPSFLLGYADEDRNGQLELWPRVAVRKLASEGSLLDDTDTNDDGTLDVVVLAARWVLTPEQEAQLAAPNSVLPVSSLTLAVLAQALDATNPAASPVPLPAVPPGRYSITVVQRPTGQSWRVPNELSAPYADQYDLPEISNQGFTITVPAP